MSKLTIKQKRFADEYIISGNATEAYKIAYSNVTKETTANANSSRLLRNAKVSAYIEERMEELEDKAIAKQSEILQILTTHARRTSTEYEVTKDGDVVETPTTIANSIRAAELLGKRYRMWTDKVELDGALPVIISGEDALED